MSDKPLSISISNSLPDRRVLNSAPAKTYPDDPCKGNDSTYMDCESYCRRVLKFKDAYMNWDG